MANKTFGSLSRAEECILLSASLGEIAWCGRSTDYWSEANNPIEARAWHEERNVRASLVSWLYLSEAIELVHPAGITIVGAKLLGKLDFFCAKLSRNLEVARSSVEHGIDLSFAETFTLIFRGCASAYLRAPRLIAKGDVLLGQNSDVRGLIDLYQAEISGDLDLRGANVWTGGNDAVGAHLAHIGGNCRFEDDFKTDGIVRLSNAHVAGDVSFSGASFVGDRENGLDARRMVAVGSLEWLPVSITNGTVLDLRDAKVATLIDSFNQYGQSRDISESTVSYLTVSATIVPRTPKTASRGSKGSQRVTFLSRSAKSRRCSMNPAVMVRRSSS